MRKREPHISPSEIKYREKKKLQRNEKFALVIRDYLDFWGFSWAGNDPAEVPEEK